MFLVARPKFTASADPSSWNPLAATCACPGTVPSTSTLAPPRVHQGTVQRPSGPLPSPHGHFSPLSSPEPTQLCPCREVKVERLV